MRQDAGTETCANFGDDMNTELQQQAVELVAKHGSIRAAARASGIARSTLQGRYNAAIQSGKTATKSKAEAITAYKAFDKNMQCRGYQFEVGKTYQHVGKVEACKSGFHSCENPLDVLNYYPLIDNDGSLFRIATVKASGSISRHNDDSKIASASLAVEAELTLPKFIDSAIKWISSACTTKDNAASGDSSQLAASGNSSQLAASGDSSQLAASGDSSQLAASGYSSKLAASGDSSQLAASGYSSKLAASGYSSKLAASGNYSQLAASGYYSQLAASGDSSIAVSSAPDCSARVGKNGCIVLTRWVESEKRYRVSVGYEGENGIKAGVFYKLNESGDFVEVK
jgi:hypothetical protein